MVPEGKVTAEILVSVPCHKNTANHNKGKSLHTQQYYMQYSHHVLFLGLCFTCMSDVVLYEFYVWHTFK